MPARRSVLGWRSVTQGRMPMLVIVFVFEVADDHPGFEQAVPVVAVEELAGGTQLREPVDDVTDEVKAVRPVLPRMSKAVVMVPSSL
ncbi:hypothetical protein [Mycobacterium sp.]|uniref:hypothetical protein n=1 Tax=Mycobacterium sp. TaxID=1785 RepID=UPI0039C95254